jgi:hypothetical protein
MSRRKAPEAIATVTPTEAMARVLVVALFGELEKALMRGTLYRAAIDEALAHAFPLWEAQYGRAAAVRAWEILERLGPATILTPYGRDLFNREYPLVAIPTRTPPMANDNTPPKGNGRRFYRFWDWLCGGPPASRA